MRAHDRMRVWLLTVGEPLPTDGSNERLLRTGILAEHLSRQGHEVHWWTSSFDHVRKRQRTSGDQQVTIRDGYEITLLAANSYASNISFRRMANHRAIARKFRAMAHQQASPDIVVCSWPLIELSAEAVRFGVARGVPVVLDFRDMWPDAIVDLAPRCFRPAARLALHSTYRAASFAASQATAITGITEKIVDWGIEKAGRQRRATDRAFSMGYQAPSFSEECLGEANRFWKSLGLVQDDSQFIVCFFGTIGRHFEMETVTEAAAKLAQSRRAIKFVICGDGPTLARWKQVSESLPNVILPGWVDAAKIHALMRISSVGLAPYVSSWDFQLSIPNKPIEYMSAGLPVVSSLRGVLAGVLQEHRCGLTYENGDSNDLVRQLSHCYDHPALRTGMSENASRLFRQRFTAEAVYAAMQEYLLGIVADARSVIAA